jgi:MYXO-CTERM domain-containing protein
VVVVRDAASVTPTGPDASPANRDAGTATPVEPPAKKHSGCSFSASSGRGNLVSAFVVALLVGILRRRR